uniref:Uncharacterized protein n=2 Tax=Ornithorhynchus anatinus TaxID=9258 RepID=A0A6I8NZZ1_ORNAN
MEVSFPAGSTGRERRGPEAFAREAAGSPRSCQGGAMAAAAPNHEGPGDGRRSREGGQGKWQRTPGDRPCYARQRAGWVPPGCVQPWKEDAVHGRAAAGMSYGRIAPGTWPSSAAARPSTMKDEGSSESSSSESEEMGSGPKRKWKRCFYAGANRGAAPSSQILPRQRGRKVNTIWSRVLEEQNQDALTTELFLMDVEDDVDRGRESETYNYLQARRLRWLQEKEKLDEELDEYMRRADRMEKEEGGSGQSRQVPRRPVRERLGPREEYSRWRAVAGEKSEEEAAEEIFSRPGGGEDNMEEFI